MLENHCSRLIVAVIVTSAIGSAGCPTTDPLYCDLDTPCTDPTLPFCDLLGEYPQSGFHGRTCISCPFTEGCPNGDAGVDAMPGDAPAIPTARIPHNGAATGSAFATATTPLRPTFGWTEVIGAINYEIQVDDSCDVSDWTSCDFPSPEIAESVQGTTHIPPSDLPVSSAPPVGTRYYWRIRSCDDDACSGWSRPRYVDVGRQTGDINGDGYADVLIGAPQQLVDDQGWAVVYPGSELGVGAVSPWVVVDPNPQTEGHFASRVAHLGDVNADGFADILVTAPDYDVAQTQDRGIAYVYLGDASGLPAAPSTTIPAPLSLSGRFGMAIAAGDVNADGFADAVVGSDLGRAFLFPGSVTGIAQIPTHTLQPDGPTVDGFGSSMTTANINGDDYADVAVVGVLEGAAGSGDLFVFLGSTGGPGAAPIVRMVDVDAPYDGHVGSAGDMDADGFDELSVGYLVGVWNDPGQVVTFAGESAGLSAEPISSTDGEPSSLAGGDVNGDSFDDLIVGLLSFSTFMQNPSVVATYAGAPNRVFEPGASLTGVVSVLSVSAGDINGDGLSDAVVGAQAADDGEALEGSVLIYYGSSTGLLEAPTTTIDNPDDEAGGRFGASVSLGR